MSDELPARALDPQSVPERRGSGYPEPFRAAVAGRAKRALGDALGLTQFGVNPVKPPPGCWSSQRHWDSHEDGFVYVLSGEPTLVTDAGEQRPGPGMGAGFPAGDADAHHLINRTVRPATYLEVGTHAEDVDRCDYPDIDLRVRHDADGRQQFVHQNGRPYGVPAARRREEKPS